MTRLACVGARVPEILLPQGVDEAKWAVVACDQYTSQPEVWEETERLVGAAPSTLRLVLPEVYLSDASERVPRIHAAMRAYLSDVLTRAVRGLVLTERRTESGPRRGLLLSVDLEEYDFLPGSVSRVRATEGTILSRIPARTQVRRGAPLECPHVMLLVDDPRQTLIEPLYARRRMDAPLYDVELLQGMGHLTGWAVTGEGGLRRGAADDAARRQGAGVSAGAAGRVRVRGAAAGCARAARGRARGAAAAVCGHHARPRGAHTDLRRRALTLPARSAGRGAARDGASPSPRGAGAADLLLRPVSASPLS